MSVARRSLATSAVDGPSERWTGRVRDLAHARLLLGRPVVLELPGTTLAGARASICRVDEERGLVLVIPDEQPPERDEPQAIGVTVHALGLIPADLSPVSRPSLGTQLHATRQHPGATSRP